MDDDFGWYAPKANRPAVKSVIQTKSINQTINQTNKQKSIKQTIKQIKVKLLLKLHKKLVYLEYEKKERYIIPIIGFTKFYVREPKSIFLLSVTNQSLIRFWKPLWRKEKFLGQEIFVIREDWQFLLDMFKLFASPWFETDAMLSSLPYSMDRIRKFFKDIGSFFTSGNILAMG